MSSKHLYSTHAHNEIPDITKICQDTTFFTYYLIRYESLLSMIEPYEYFLLFHSD